MSAAVQAKRSIRDWTNCGAADNTAGLTAAFAAARNGAFVLTIDCPVHLHVGTDIDKAIFIDNGTTVEFTGTGKLTVDNIMTPAFVIANSSGITLTDWIVEFDGSLPVNPAATLAGFERAGVFVAGQMPGAAFNNFRLTQWLTANRGIVFNGSQGYSTARWTGSTNICAIFYVSGESSNLTVTGMHVSVPANAGGDRFVPVVFSFNPDFRSNQTVTAATPFTVAYFDIPHFITFSDVTFDGTYMGLVGSLRHAVFDNLQSYRYGDLQDARGGTVGGVGKWFAPPHLFYFNYSPDDDPALFNRNIHISNVTDHGDRVGHARDLGGSDPGSGNALSLKIGCVTCSVANYASARPDGFLDVLASNGLTISNATASYNSAFLNNLYPGWRFPKPPYANLTFDNIALTDVAPSTVHLPIDNAYQASNQTIHMSNVKVTINRWAGAWALPFPTIAGNTNDVALSYVMKAQNEAMMRSSQGSMEATLQISPATVQTNKSSTLTWSTQNATSCAPVGAWTGKIAAYGTHAVKLVQAGGYDFGLECRGGSQTITSTVAATATP